jgi:flagellar biosynthesis/type III secretory pathway chaperone
MRFEGESEPRVMKIEDIALFDKLNIGDRVRLCCKREYSIVRDYVPPDFQNKKVVCDETASYEFIKAELLEAAKAL